MAKIVSVFLFLTLLSVVVSPVLASVADDVVLAVNDNGAVAVITADSVGGNGTDNGTPDIFRLVRNGPDVVLNIDGKFSRSFAFDSLYTIIVDGSGDDDTLTIDFSQGTPVPYGGLTYNGQDNGSGGDSLEIVGGTMSSVGYEYTGLSDGVITIDESIVRYTGLEPVIDLVPAATFTINGTTGANTINYTTGSPTTQGKVAVDIFETVEFANKTNLVINANEGSDNISLNNSSLPTGLSAITVNGGQGNDVFNLLNAGIGLPGPVSLNGGDGDDTFQVSPSTSAVVNVNGGNGIDGLAVDAQGTPAWDTGSAILFSSSSGFKAVNYTGFCPNVEMVTIVNYTPTSIGDFVWEDTNTDGIQNISESGIDGVAVNLYKSDYTPAGTTTTAGGGLYSFTDLIPGDYYVEFDTPPGYVFSPQDQGGDDTIDSDADTTTGKTTVTTLDPGENDTTWDAGMYQPASIGNFVWEDTHANGIQNIGIDGVTVNLYKSDDTPAGTTTTAGGGLYSFTDLIPGDYYVEFDIPPGYVFSPQDQGGDNTLDSDADTNTGKTIVTTLDPGENDTTWDAGMYQPQKQPYAAGGEVYPVNRLIALLAPWIILAAAVLAVGIFLIRRRAFRSK